MTTPTHEDACWREQAQELCSAMRLKLEQLEDIMRRHNHDIRASMPEIHWRELTINTDVNLMSIEGRAIKLTLLEWKILRYLAINRNRWCSYERISANVWGTSIDGKGDAAVIKIHVCHLRAKLAPLDIIEAITGCGYRCYMPEDKQP